MTNLRFFHLALILSLIFPLSAFSQKFTLSGYIKDKSNGEDLIGATVYVKELGTGTTANMYGFYSITLPAGNYTIDFSYIGFTKTSKTFDLKSNINFNVELETNEKVLKEVVISAEREDQKITEVQMSVEKLNMETIQKIPQLLGEADVVKSIQLRPGVSTVGEGAMGFNVRGGNIDQNLILLDEAPIFNSSHLFGFFSTFNPDAIKDAQLYKGGIPARYGGRLSSVFDVRQRDGNMKEFHGQGGIGALFSRLTFEGPIVKNKSSFLVSGRRSYADVFLRNTEDFKDSKAYFYDLNMKLNYIINDKNRVYVSGYFGRDVFAFGSEFRNYWGNTSLSARWNRLISDKVFMNLTGFISQYSYGLSVPEGANAFEWESQLDNYNIKSDFTWYASPNNTVEFGVNGLFYKFQPGRAEGIGSSSFFNVIQVPLEYAFEPAVYVSNEQKVKGRITLKYGLRYSHFFNLGPTQVNDYANGVPTRDQDITGATNYNRNEVIADYGGLEPRFAINYTLNTQSAIKGSYMRTRQYLHLVSNTSSATPLDVWKPAGRYVKPATADQIALGYFRNLKNNIFEISFEAYYKNFNDLLDYKDGANLLLNKNVENQFLTGNGRAYGLEFMIEKRKGRFTGWISYTLSRSELKVEGYTAGNYFESENGINNGNWYPSNWDKLHDLTLVGSYTINERWELSATWAYNTGRPISVPVGRYTWDNKTTASFRGRNNFRIPDFHRLDVSAVVKLGNNREKRWQSSLAFGVYNLYGRKNPYSIFFRPQENNPVQTEAVRLAIIGIPVPSITYNFKF